MPKFKQGKSLIITLICLMFVALVSFSCVSALTSNRDKIQEPSSANKIWYIEDADDLEQFAESVCCAGVQFYNGEEVYLEADIDLGGVNLEPIGSYYRDNGDSLFSNSSYACDAMFNGTFHGQGHTISNFTMRARGFNNVGYGLFALLGPQAVVKDLKVKDMQVTTYAWKNEDDVINTSTGHVGGIAGLAIPGATVETCMVENLKVTVCKGFIYGNKSNGTSSYVSGLIGSTSLQSWYAPPLNDYGWPPEDKRDWTVKIRNCIVKNFDVDSSQVSNYTGGQLILANGLSMDCSVQNVLIINGETGYKYFNDYNSDDISYYGCSQSSGKISGYDYTDTWFYDSSLYDGYSMLRVFINTITVYFKSNDTSQGTVNISSAEVTETDIANFGKSTKAQMIGDTYVYAEGRTDYDFKEWIYSSTTKTFTAYFKLKTYVVTLSSITYDGVTVYAKLGTTIKSSVNVTAKSTLKLTYDAISKAILLKNGSTELARWTISDSKFLKYYCEDNTYSITGGNKTITPTLKLKSYIVNVG